jgi:hypothetical protein
LENAGVDRKDIIGQRKKLLEVVFIIRPSLDFVREAKAANRRLTVATQNK